MTFKGGLALHIALIILILLFRELHHVARDGRAAQGIGGRDG